MSQPQIIIAGLGSTFDDYGLILTDKSIFPEAEIKEHLIDVPGRSGSLDLSESVQGDIAYADVVNTLVLELCDSSDVTEIRRKFVNALSGRLVDYVCSWDPDYTLRGRWKFGDAERVGESWCRFTVLARTDPYKLKETCTYRVNAAGGIMITLESGRMPVCPTFEFASETIVACGDAYAQMQPGSYKVNDLWLHEGINEIYLNSYLGDGNVAAERYQDDTIAMHADKRISDLIWDGIRGAALIIEDWVDDTISMHADERIIDTAHAVSTDTEAFAVYIQYPWKDL